MEQQTKTDMLTQLILEVFRLNGALLDVGDSMTSPLGLTSARWQILGAISLENKPLTVSQISRRMGQSRQAVQRVVDDLEKLGFVDLRDNPHHKRARLVSMNEKSEVALQHLNSIQSQWAHTIVEGLDDKLLGDMLILLKLLRYRCEASKEKIDRKN